MALRASRRLLSRLSVRPNFGELKTLRVASGINENKRPHHAFHESGAAFDVGGGTGNRNTMTRLKRPPDKTSTSCWFVCCKVPVFLLTQQRQWTVDPCEPPKNPKSLWVSTSEWRFSTEMVGKNTGMRNLSSIYVVVVIIVLSIVSVIDTRLVYLSISMLLSTWRRTGVPSCVGRQLPPRIGGRT